MKRFALLLVSLVLWTPIIGCSDGAATPPQTPGKGPATGPPTAGQAQKDKEKMLKDMDDAVAKAKAAEKSP